MPGTTRNERGAENGRDPAFSVMRESRFDVNNRYRIERKEISMRSDTVTKGVQQAPHRSLFNALGYTKE